MGLKDEKQKVTGSPPDFSSREGVAVWVNTTKTNQEYLTVQILGKNGIKVNCFKTEPKKQEQTERY